MFFAFKGGKDWTVAGLQTRTWANGNRTKKAAARGLYL